MTKIKKEDYLSSKRVPELKELASKNKIKIPATISKADLVSKLKHLTKVQLEIPADAEAKSTKSSAPKTKKSSDSTTKEEKKSRSKKSDKTSIPREEMEASFLDFMSTNDNLNEIYNRMTDLYYRNCEGKITDEQRKQLSDLVSEAAQLQKGMSSHKAHSYVEKIKVSISE